ncbi:MAG: hypothetical protein P8X89_24185, partial [Reinekea sp.]
MDRYRPCDNTEYYYNPAYQEDGQHAFQPETGQTSAGVAASGAWGNYPAPTQPQPYQDLNPPGQIPSWATFQDWETFQPTTVEDLSQHDALPESSTAPVRRRKSRAKGLPPVKERFLAGLEAFRRGAPLKDCSATLPFYKYVTDSGLLLPQGEALRNSLSAEDQMRVNEALLCRSKRHSKQEKNMPPVEERFLASLDNYAQGLLLNECSEDIQLRSYLTDDGRLLQGRGQPLYNRLSRDDKERVDKALAARGKIYAQHIARDVAKFMATLEPYGNGLSLQECGTFSGLKKKASVYLTPEGGLTYKGQRLIENLQPDQLNKVLEAIRKRLQHAELDPQVSEPERLWSEMPASMPEMGGMDPTAMVDPIQMEFMQTEAMGASLWQLTGQVVPGPSGSAAPSIPYYDSEAVEADFQHQYDPHGLPLPPVKERFLAGLEAFGRGAPLTDCSATLSFSNYIRSDGRMTGYGIPLYNRLSDEEKTRLDQAIIARQGAKFLRLAEEETVTERFLAGLENYAQGASLKGCSETLAFKNYATDDGVLRQAGKDVCKGLSAEDLNRVNQALLRRREHYLGRAMNKAPVEERFLAGLENYARGARLVDCSATLPFNKYVTDSGLLLPSGEALRKSLSAEDQARVNEALFHRSEAYSKQAKDMSSTKERFLASLDNYAQGLLLNECSKDITLRVYLSDDGRLQPKRGLPLYNKLSRNDKERVDKALAARGKIYAQHIARDVDKFMATLELYSNGLSLQECGTLSGLNKKISVYLTPEGGLTHKGQRLIENLQPDQLNQVLEAIEKRQQNTGLNPSVPEPAWQWPEMPASMPETEGMDLTAMYTPMQTEAMMAAAWQYTGQTMPGTWGIPWESAEPSIPHYGSDAVGRDFR